MTKENKQDGFSFFPPRSSLIEDNRGIRDRLAATALQGMLAHATRYKPHASDPDNWHEAIAKEAYEIAYAMLAERSKAADAWNNRTPPKVKPLEWARYPDWEVTTVSCLKYRVHRGYGVVAGSFAVSLNGSAPSPEHETGWIFDSLEEAKAAAQAHHDKLVLSMLEDEQC